MLFLNVIEDVQVRDFLEEIYQIYKKELFYIALDILNDYHEAEDVVHTAIIKFSEYIDENMDVKCHKTKGLIVIIVRNLSFNIYKQRQNRLTTNIDHLEDFIQDENNMSPEVNVLRLDQSHEMAKSLAKINAAYADILSLRYAYEYSNSEIAAILSISEMNVRKRLSRAKKSLKKIIEGGGSHEQG